MTFFNDLDRQPNVASAFRLSAFPPARYTQAFEFMKFIAGWLLDEVIAFAV
jgi:hypothetical protein